MSPFGIDVKTVIVCAMLSFRLQVLSLIYVAILSYLWSVCPLQLKCINLTDCQSECRTECHTCAQVAIILFSCFV